MKHYEDFFIEAQQYSDILKRYRENGEIFKDPNFHPNSKIKETQLALDKENCTWRRIDEFYTAPLFKKELISEEAIEQGEINDSYFISSLIRIAKQPEIVPKLFDTRSISEEKEDTVNLKCGAVVIYFHVFGKRTPVLIDTLIPFKRGSRNPLFSRPTSLKYSAWFCLVEKAYAKLQGSYTSIINGTLSQGIYHLFGYYPCFYTIDSLLEKRTNKQNSKKNSQQALQQSPSASENTQDFNLNDYLFSKMMKWQYENSVLGADIDIRQLKNEVNEEEIKDKGLVPSRTYLIEKVRYEDDKKFICLRNPKTDEEWLGDWSSTSSLWTCDMKRKLGYAGQSDATFWMNDRDFFRYFSSFDVCKAVNPEFHVRSIMTKLEPGDHDGYDIKSEEVHLEERQAFVFKMKNVRVKTQKQSEEEEKTEAKCQIVDDVKIHVTVEKRSPKIYSIGTEEGGGGEEDCEDVYPQYQILVVYSNGQRVSHSTIENFSRQTFTTSGIFFKFTIHVLENEPFVMILTRKDKRRYTEECYMTFSSEYDFELRSIDETNDDNENNDNNDNDNSKEEEKVGIIFSNESKRYENVAREIITKNINDEEVKGYSDKDKDKDKEQESEFDMNFYRHLKLKRDLTSKSGFYEYEITDDENEDDANLVPQSEAQSSDPQKGIMGLIEKELSSFTNLKDQASSQKVDDNYKFNESLEKISSISNDTSLSVEDKIPQLFSSLKALVLSCAQQPSDNSGQKAVSPSPENGNDLIENDQMASDWANKSPEVDSFTQKLCETLKIDHKENNFDSILNTLQKRLDSISQLQEENESLKRQAEKSASDDVNRNNPNSEEGQKLTTQDQPQKSDGNDAQNEQPAIQERGNIEKNQPEKSSKEQEEANEEVEIECVHEEDTYEAPPNNELALESSAILEDLGAAQNSSKNDATKTKVSIDEIESSSKTEATKTNFSIDDIESIPKNDAAKAKVSFDDIESSSKNDTTKTKVSIGEIESSSKTEATKTNVSIDDIESIPKNDAAKAKVSTVDIESSSKTEATKTKVSIDIDSSSLQSGAPPVEQGSSANQPSSEEVAQTDIAIDESSIKFPLDESKLADDNDKSKREPESDATTAKSISKLSSTTQNSTSNSSYNISQRGNQKVVKTVWKPIKNTPSTSATSLQSEPQKTVTNRSTSVDKKEDSSFLDSDRIWPFEQAEDPPRDFAPIFFPTSPGSRRRKKVNDSQPKLSSSMIVSLNNSENFKFTTPKKGVASSPNSPIYTSIFDERSEIPKNELEVEQTRIEPQERINSQADERSSSKIWKVTPTKDAERPFLLSQEDAPEEDTEKVQNNRQPLSKQVYSPMDHVRMLDREEKAKRMTSSDAPVDVKKAAEKSEKVDDQEKVKNKAKLELSPFAVSESEIPKNFPLKKSKVGIKILISKLNGEPQVSVTSLDENSDAAKQKPKKQVKVRGNSVSTSSKPQKNDPKSDNKPLTQAAKKQEEKPKEESKPAAAKPKNNKEQVKKAKKQPTDSEKSKDSEKVENSEKAIDSEKIQSSQKVSDSEKVHGSQKVGDSEKIQSSQKVDDSEKVQSSQKLSESEKVQSSQKFSESEIFNSSEKVRATEKASDASKERETKGKSNHIKKASTKDNDKRRCRSVQSRDPRSKSRPQSNKSNSIQNDRYDINDNSLSSIFTSPIEKPIVKSSSQNRYDSSVNPYIQNKDIDYDKMVKDTMSKRRRRKVHDRKKDDEPISKNQFFFNDSDSDLEITAGNDRYLDDKLSNENQYFKFRIGGNDSSFSNGSAQECCKAAPDGRCHRPRQSTFMKIYDLQTEQLNCSYLPARSKKH